MDGEGAVRPREESKRRADEHDTDLAALDRFLGEHDSGATSATNEPVAERAPNDQSPSPAVDDGVAFPDPAKLARELDVTAAHAPAVEERHNEVAEDDDSSNVEPVSGESEGTAQQDAVVDVMDVRDEANDQLDLDDTDPAEADVLDNWGVSEDEHDVDANFDEPIDDENDLNYPETPEGFDVHGETYEHEDERSETSVARPRLDPEKRKRMVKAGFFALALTGLYAVSSFWTGDDAQPIPTDVGDVAMPIVTETSDLGVDSNAEDPATTEPSAAAPFPSLPDDPQWENTAAYESVRIEREFAATDSVADGGEAAFADDLPPAPDASSEPDDSTPKMDLAPGEAADVATAADLPAPNDANGDIQPAADVAPEKTPGVDALAMTDDLFVGTTDPASLGRISNLEDGQAMISGQVAAIETQVGKLEGAIDALTGEVAKMRAEQIIDARERDELRRKMEKPQIDVQAIIRPSTCPDCTPYAMINFEGKSNMIGDGDTFLGYQVTIAGNRLTLVTQDAQFSYFVSR